VDVVLVATVSHLMQTPAAATLIAHEIGATPAAAFDVSAACAGFTYGIALASDMVRVGTARNVLVIGVEKLSDITNPVDRGTAFIFADGAGAVVVGASEEQGIGPVVWGADGDKYDLIRQTVAWDDVFAEEEKVWPALQMQGARSSAGPRSRWRRWRTRRWQRPGSPSTTSTPSSPTRRTCESPTPWPAP
jgi:3-oxoacyl-(acyl-carrier-protein) synthase III